MRYLVFVYPEDTAGHAGWSSFVDSADTFEEIDDLFYSQSFANRMDAYKVPGEYVTLTYQIVDLNIIDVTEVGTVTIDSRGRITVEMG